MTNVLLTDLGLSIPPSSDPGHKKFWKRETGSMFSLRKTPEANVSIVTDEYLGLPR